MVYLLQLSLECFEDSQILLMRVQFLKIEAFINEIITVIIMSSFATFKRSFSLGESRIGLLRLTKKVG